MQQPVLHIVEPLDGAWITKEGDVPLKATIEAESIKGLSFRWYSSLNPAAIEEHPELNPSDHSAAVLDWATPLDVGTHVITLAATDSDDVTAVTRAGVAGGTGAAPAPCVIHRLWATLKTPDDQAKLSKASATLEARAPSGWAKEDPSGSDVYVNDDDYHALSKIRYRFRFAPAGKPDELKSADVIPSVKDFTFFIDEDDDKPYVRWSGPLPKNLGTGPYVLTLHVESPDGSVGHSVSRNVTLTS